MTSCSPGFLPAARFQDWDWVGTGWWLPSVETEEEQKDFIKSELRLLVFKRHLDSADNPPETPDSITAVFTGSWRSVGSSWGSSPTLWQLKPSYRKGLLLWNNFLQFNLIYCWGLIFSEDNLSDKNLFISVWTKWWNDDKSSAESAVFCSSLLQIQMLWIPTSSWSLWFHCFTVVLRTTASDSSD